MDNRVEEIRNYSPYMMSDIVDVGSPDSFTSPGGEFLRDIRDGLLDAYEENPDMGYVMDQGDDVVDSSISVYAYPMWEVFLDLQLYTKPVEEYFQGDMTDQARSILRDVGYTLYRLLVNELFGESL